MYKIYLLAFLSDVTDESCYESLVSEITEDLGNEGLNVLFNNAGIGAVKPLGLQDVYSDDLMENYRVNAVAPVMLTKVKPLIKWPLTKIYSLWNIPPNS